MNPKRYFNALVVALFIFILAVAGWRLKPVQAAVDLQATITKPNPFDDIQERIEAAGSFDFTTVIEQTLIPRPIPANIGTEAERIDSQLSGRVELPDFAQMTLQFEAGADMPPITMEQRGGETYLLQNGERTLIENPVGTAVPTQNTTSYLQAATNIQIKTDERYPELTIYTFDIDGARYAELMRDAAQAQLPPAQQANILTPSPILQGMTGSGELWVDGNGLPRRQIIDTAMPKINEWYDSQAHTVTDFTFPPTAASAGLGQAVSSQPTTSASAGERQFLSLTKLNFNPTPNLVVYVAFALGGILFCLALVMRPYRLRVPIPILIAFILVSSPILQSVVYAQPEDQAEAIPLLEALGMANETTETAVTPPTNTPETTAVKMQTASDSDQCGDGSKTSDYDADGITDYVEICLGTDYKGFDSDGDMITDTLEIQGFVFTNTLNITTTFYSDPTNVDSNGDGLSDFAEWPEPIGSAPSIDPDGDDIPNLWDSDNDGDGIPDSSDIDPYSVSGYDNSFSLKSTLGSGTFDGYQYIEFQVQPENRDHLRYTATALDWPYDEDGTIQDLDSSTDDLTLTPFIKVTTQNEPSFDLMDEYGITYAFVKEDGVWWTHLYVPLTPLSDGGRITAFEGRVVYGAGDLQDITWTDMELVWLANMQVDVQNGNDIKSSSTPLAEFSENFRLAGLEITKSGQTDYALLGTPHNQADNRDLFNILLGLDQTYLASTAVDLDEIVTRFNTPTTPLTQTWGVTAADVAVSFPADPLDHYDALVNDLPDEIVSFLGNNGYSTAVLSTTMASLILTMETEMGWQSLDDYDDGDNSDNTFTFNLTNIPLNVTRSANLTHYQHNGSSWESMDINDILEVVELRHYDPTTSLNNLQTAYPDVEAADLFVLLIGYTYVWTMGRSQTISTDGVSLVADTASDAAVSSQLRLDTVTDLSTYLVQAANLGIAGGGLVFNDTLAYYDYLNSEESGGYAAEEVAVLIVTFLKRAKSVYSLLWGLNNVSTFAGVYNWNSLLETWFYYLKSMETMQFAKLAKVRPVQSMLKSATRFAAKYATKLSKVLAVVGLVMAAAFFIYEQYNIWAAYAGFSSPYQYEKDYQLAYAIVSAVVSTAMLVAGFFGGGIVVLLAVMFLQLLALAISGGSFDFLATFMTQIAELFVDNTVYTQLLNFEFAGLEASITEPLLQGNTLTLSDTYSGYIWRKSGNDNTQLDLSETYAWFAASAGSGVTVAAKRYDSECTIGRYTNYSTHRYYDNTKMCANDLEASFTFNNAGINQSISLLHKVYAATRYEQCIVGVCNTDTNRMTLPDDLDDSWSSMDVAIDVLPNTLSGVWQWNELTNLDPDGDGLINSAEASLGTNANAWDSDGDGLSDGFEANVRAELGTNPLDADSDDDGLDDGFEYQLGTTINDSDSDDDGLSDGFEAFHWDGSQWTGGGWMVTIDGQDYWVFSSPLAGDDDNDGLNDASEYNAGSSPGGANDAPSLTLDTGPHLFNPTGDTAVYVSSGQTVTATLHLSNVGGSPITETLSLCWPASLTGVSLVTSGDRIPATQQSGSCANWDFSGNNLLFLQTFQADFSATAGSGTVTDTFDAAVVYPVYGSSQPISVTQAYVEDNTAPAVQVMAPVSATILAGTHYVTGGFAQDAHSWIDHVKVTIPGGTYTVTGDSPWAYTWALPTDGVVDVTAVAYDALGNASAPHSVSVTVDSLPPVITSNIPNGATISAGEALSTTVVLSGTVTDNYAGLTRVQMRYNEQPWRTLWTADSFTLNTTWSGVWQLPVVESAQGEHALHLRAYDAFGNIGYYDQTVFIDLYPPANELTNRTFTSDDPPHVPGGQAVTLYGVANDAGNNPLPADPAALSGNLNSISDATVWLQPDGMADDDGGVTVSWIGDFNGDRLGDLAVGFPAAANGAGKVVVVRGAAGDWPIPHLGDLEFLVDNRPSFVGSASAGIGDDIRPAGDFNGDGFSDMLVGDLGNGRIHLIFGNPLDFGTDRLLDDSSDPNRVEISTQMAGESIAAFATAGDVNDDTLDDLLIVTTDASGSNVYLLLGDVIRRNPQALDLLPGGVLNTAAANVAVSGVGDVDDDFIDDFAIALDNTVYLFSGGGGWVSRGMSTITTTQAIASFTSGNIPPDIVPLGDVNGDGIDDFAYSSGSSPVVVFGNAAQSFASQTLGGFPYALSGFLASAGDVDKDGQNDLLIGNSNEDAYLLLGGDLATVAATIEGVESAASAPTVSGADLVGDGSSDLLLVPSATAATNMGYSRLAAGRPSFISGDSLPQAGQTSGGRQTAAPAPAAISQPMAIMAGDVTVGFGSTVDFNSIQAAINSGASRVLIDPGVYAEVITLTNNVIVAGSGADRTYLTFPNGITDTVLVQADGVSGSSLMNLSLIGNGSDGGEMGLQAINGAGPITLTRAIIRDMGTAVSLDGAAIDLILKNNTVIGNAAGLNAANCASVDIRSTIFAYNTGTALQYQGCAAIQRHQYNLYWANGTDMSPNDPGGGELFSDPLFVDYGGNDFRTADNSPVIDAGATADPVPPGAGDFADIGHMEQTSGSFFAADDYCATCINNGLIWDVDAFDTIQAAVDAAWYDLTTLRSDDPVQFSIGVGGGVYTESVVISGSLQLLGSDADNTAIQGVNGPAVTAEWAAGAAVSGFTLTGGGADPIGLLITNGSNTVEVSYNLIQNNSIGISVTQRSSGWGELNTIISNTIGVHTYGQYNWFYLESSIVSGNNVGLQADGPPVQFGNGIGAMFSEYNLLNNSLNYTNVVTGLYDIVGQAPLLTGTHAYLQTGSPAIDTASPLAEVPPGGGLVADIGWHELMVPPISILMGQGDDSIATESIGVSQVEYAVVPVAVITSPVTATLPSAWTDATLASPGAKLTYWQAAYTPVADGLYRIYSRATDALGNSETDNEDWYKGAFVVDSVAPVVTLTLDTGPLWAGSNWLLLKGEVADYVGDSFDVAEIYFEIDGVRVAAAWDVEIWTEDGSSARSFHYVYKPSGSPQLHTFQAVAVDGAGNTGSSGGQTHTIGNAFLGDFDPTVNSITIEDNQLLPAPFNILITDTVYIYGFGWAQAYEISLDGGTSWNTAARNWLGYDWVYSQTVPFGLDATTIPVLVRATNWGGRSTIAESSFTVDTGPPQGFPPVEFSLPYGSHLDQITTMTSTWRLATDGSGETQALVSYGASAPPTFDADTPMMDVATMGGGGIGEYANIGVRDPAGNLAYQSFGFWYPGSVLPRNSGLWSNTIQSMSATMDGVLDIEHNEWLTPTEWLDDDDRPDATQSLYAAWDGAFSYIGWQGGWWGVDGTMWVYYDTQAGGTTTPVTGSLSLPFDADLAFSIAGENSGTIWSYSGATWTSSTFDSWSWPQAANFAHDHDLGGTEVNIMPIQFTTPSGTAGMTNIRLMAFALDNDGAAWSAFPTANELDSNFNYYYEWPIVADDWDLLNLPVSSQEPYLTLSAASTPPSQDSVSVSDSLQYVVEVANVEDEMASGVKLLVSGSTGLTYQSVAGAAAYDCSAGDTCVVDLAAFTASMTQMITVTAVTAANLTGISNVTTTMQLMKALPVPGTLRSISHQVDVDAPTVTIFTDPGNAALGVGSQSVSGGATDGLGVGVAYVEVSTDGVIWQQASGTESWTAVVATPASPTWQLQVRATDYHSQTGSIASVTFVADSIAPIITPTVPALVGGQSFAQMAGLVRDPAPTGSQVETVAMQIDRGSASWDDGVVYDPQGNGEQSWFYPWSLPYEDGVTHTVRFRGIDYAGNIVTSSWYTTVVDTVSPAITVTQQLTQVVPLSGTAVLSGTISDGTGISQIRVLIYPATGAGIETTATLNGNKWSVTLNQPLGQYTLYLISEDLAGNDLVLGPYDVEVVQQHLIFLPMITR